MSFLIAGAARFPACRRTAVYGRASRLDIAGHTDYMLRHLFLCESIEPMRAETQSLVDDIKQSLSLLRRHL
jgi:hypothetical protein